MSTTEPMPIAEVSADQDKRRRALIERIGSFADLLSCEPIKGEKGDIAYELLRQAAAQISSDRLRLTALADAERKLASAKAVLKTLSECPMSGWTIGQAMARQLLAAQDGENK